MSGRLLPLDDGQVRGTIGAVQFTYRLTGTGWAEAQVTDRATSVTIPASYLVDALGVLLDAVGALLDGADESRCSWEVEPGEYRWIFTCADDRAQLRVLAFKEAYPAESNDKGALVFETSQPLAEMAAAFLGGAQAILDEYGEDGYLQLWVEYPFPRRGLEMIRESLANRSAMAQRRTLSAACPVVSRMSTSTTVRTRRLAADSGARVHTKVHAHAYARLKAADRTTTQG